MDRILKYQQAILDFLNTYAEEVYGRDDSGMETQVIADKENHHYQLLRLGWDNKRFYFYCPFHFDIKGDKIWIQVNNTEPQVADELMLRDIPAENIVLGFHHERMRAHTGFAVA